MINSYLLLVSSKKSQIAIFILLNICGLIFFILPHNIFSNMLDLRFSYSVSDVIGNFEEIGVDGRRIYIYTSLILDTIYPILYTSLFLGAFSKLFKNKKIILFMPLCTFSFDILENLQITRLNLNYPNIDEIYVFFSSLTTSAKWIAIAIMLVLLIFGLYNKRKKNSYP